MLWGFLSYGGIPHVNRSTKASRTNNNNISLLKDLIILHQVLQRYSTSTLIISEIED